MYEWEMAFGDELCCTLDCYWTNPSSSIQSQNESFLMKPWRLHAEVVSYYKKLDRCEVLDRNSKTSEQKIVNSFHSKPLRFGRGCKASTFNKSPAFNRTIPGVIIWDKFETNLNFEIFLANSSWVTRFFFISNAFFQLRLRCCLKILKMQPHFFA